MTTTTHEQDMHEWMMTEAREMGALAGEQCADGEAWTAEDMLAEDAALLRQVSGEGRLPRDVVDAYHEAARAADGTHR